MDALQLDIETKILKANFAKNMMLFKEKVPHIYEYYSDYQNKFNALKKRYDTMFKSVPDLNAEIVNRIVLGNKVIDKEKVTINGNIFYAIAIYEVKDGLISKVTFIQ